jgi:hypothetical protein
MPSSPNPSPQPKVGLQAIDYSAAAPHEPKPSLSQRLWGALKTFLWVAPITALIWIYAEREQIAKQADVRVQIVARSNAADRIVTLLSPDDKYITLDLSGPRASLDKVRDLLTGGRRPLDLNISEDPGFEGEISAIDRIGKNDIFVANAVSVSRARPAVRVRVEAKGTRQIPIKPRMEDKIVGKVTFEPDTVAVDGPKDFLDSLPAEFLVAYADLSRFVGQKPDKYEETVNITFASASENVKLSRTSVKAKVDIRETSVPHTLRSIPVLVLIPSRVLEVDKFKIQSQSTLPNISITGPSEAIAAIKEGKFAPSVVVELTPADLAAAGDKVIKIKSEHYRMPKDVAVQNPEREITVTLTERL